MMPAKAWAQDDMLRATEARGLLDAALWERPCRLLPRQGHARGVTQEDKFSLSLQGLGGSWALSSAPRADLLRY